MKDIIERLEKCDGPDRVLDGLIFRAIAEKPGDVWTNDFDDGVWHRQDPEDRVAFDPPPYYTRSVDAALALVPRGWDCCLTQSFDEPSTACLAPAGKVAEVSADAPTLAIALCIAALKARVHLRDASEQKAVSPEGADGPQHMEASNG